MCVVVNLQLRCISAVCWQSPDSHSVSSLNTFQVLSTSSLSVFDNSATSVPPPPPPLTQIFISIQTFQCTQSSTCSHLCAPVSQKYLAQENNVFSLVSKNWQMYPPWWPTPMIYEKIEQKNAICLPTMALWHQTPGILYLGSLPQVIIKPVIWYRLFLKKIWIACMFPVWTFSTALYRRCFHLESTSAHQHYC